LAEIRFHGIESWSTITRSAGPVLVANGGAVELELPLAAEAVGDPL
jgi:hypothetical protein